MAFRLVFLLPLLALVALQAAAGRPQPPPLRVAVAGLVHGHADGFLSHVLGRADVQIVGIAEPDRSLFDRYAAKFHLAPALYRRDLEDLLRADRPQAVLAYSSTFDHRRIVELCARYAVAVMMEKPLATTFEDAEAIGRAARSSRIPVLVNYETSWYPSNHAAYDLLHSGALGEIRKVVIHDGHEGPKEIRVQPEFLAWLTDPKLDGGGALFDFGCYGADLMTWLLDGRRPSTVTAVTQQIKPAIYPHVDDEATIVLTYPQAQAIVQASWNWPYSRKDMEVYGRTGSVTTIGSGEISVRAGQDQEGSRRAAPAIAAPYNDPLTYLRAVLLEGAKPDGLSSLETNLTVIEILDAARRSAASGRTVHLP